jgi:hypothetical protein
VKLSSATPPIGAPRRLFELLRSPAHVLLVFEGTQAGPLPLHVVEEIERTADFASPQMNVAFIARRPTAAYPHVAERAESTCLIDDTGDAHRRYGALGRSLYLIRPDGYVAWRSLPIDLDQLTEYLHETFTNASRELHQVPLGAVGGEN